MKRSYQQYCGLARALDVVGGRWTLLIVRELAGGPRRFRDLADGLPGIGTNLLGERVKALQQHGVIRKRTLPPPAGSTVYELTDRGRDLVPICMGLVRWGLPLLGEPSEDDELRMHWLITALAMTFDPAAARDVRLTCELGSDRAGTAHFQIHDGELETFHGPADDPDITLRGNPGVIPALFIGKIAPEAAIAQGLQLQGNVDTLRLALSLFHLTDDDPQPPEAQSPSTARPAPA